MGRTKSRRSSAVLLTPGGSRIRVGVLQERYEIIRAKGMRKYIPAYDEKVLDYIRARIQEDVNAEEDFIVKVTGPRRKAKSTGAIGCCQSLGPGLTLDDIVYTAREFGDRATGHPSSDPEHGLYSRIIWDEAGYGMFRQHWYEREQQEIIRLLEVNAAKKLVVFVVSPHTEYLNKALAGATMCKLWIDTGLSQKAGKGWATLWEGEYSQWRAMGYWKPLCAFYINPISGEFWDRYTQKKMQFIETAGRQLREAGQHEAKKLAKIMALAKQIARTAD